MGRVRVLLAGVFGASAVLSGCTGSGGDEVVTDDGSVQEALAEAADRTFSGSGRFSVSAEFPALMSMTQQGEFAGDDLAAWAEFLSAADLQDEMPASLQDQTAESTRYEQRVVGGTFYTRLDAGPGAGRFDTDKEWLAIPADGGFTAAPGSGSFWRPEELAGLVRAMEGVDEDGSGSSDGVAVTRYAGQVPLEVLDTLFGAPSDVEVDDPDPPTADRERRLDELAGRRVPVTVAAAVDELGRLREFVLVAEAGLPEDLRSCRYLSDGFEEFDGFRFELVFTDLGADITIEAPDPSTVEQQPDPLALGPVFDEGPMLDTPQGEVPRAVAESILQNAAGVALDLDPATIPSLGDDEIVFYLGLLEQVGRVSESPSVPTIPTTDGGLTREELETFVSLDAEIAGVAPDAVAAMSDTELAAAYERILAADDEWLGGDEELTDEERFEGCPA